VVKDAVFSSQECLCAPLPTEIYFITVTNAYIETNVYRVSLEKPEGYRLQGKPRRRWEDNAKMDLKVI
jgi:hypothetical protein